jgi:hypothetical protein
LSFLFRRISIYIARAPRHPQKAISNIKNRLFPVGLKAIRNAIRRMEMERFATNNILYRSSLVIVNLNLSQRRITVYTKLLKGVL